MNIIFITNDQHRHKVNSTTVDGLTGKALVETYLQSRANTNLYVGKDYEATDLDAYRAHPLLLGLGDQGQQYIIDLCTVDITDWNFPSKCKYIGHNLKYDIKLDIVHYNIHTRHVYDTMIVEQKIYQGCQMSPFFKFNLEAVTERHLEKFRRHGKDTRLEFVGKNPKTFVCLQKHVEYLAEDILDLHAIRDKQMRIVKKLGMNFWLTKYELPLVYHLAQCELNGFELDTEKWQTNVDESFLRRHEIACELDEELRSLRDSVICQYPERLKGGEYDRKRNLQPRQVYQGLFGALDKDTFYSKKNSGGKNVRKNKGKVKIVNNPNNFNWGSDVKIIYVIACIGLPVPLQGAPAKKWGYLVPQLREDSKKIYDDRGYNSENKLCVFRKESKTGYTTGKDALTKYLVDFPDTPLRKLIMLIKQWREADHEINNFGEGFASKINKITNRIHTEFRQANAVNSRFQSGGGKQAKDKPNFQNIPRKKKFRHAFKDNGRSIVTCDLGGAEVRILCDKSEDNNLYEWAIKNDDTHSPMVQNVWRHIYLFRAGLAAKAWFSTTGFINLHKKPEIVDKIQHANQEALNWYQEYQNFTVSKKENRAYRQAGKNGTFGGLYGMKTVKAAETFNNTDSELVKIDKNYTPVSVTKEEGNVILYAQKTAIPKAYAYVEANVQKAFIQGYIEYSERSRSRIWFQPIIKLFRAIREEHQQMLGIQNPSICHLGNGKYKVLETNSKYELEYMDVKKIDGKARNVPISGTQADCVKEAAVDIMDYVIENDLPIKWLSQVHDELIFSMPKNMDGQSQEWKDNPVRVVFTFDEPIKPDSIEYKEIEDKDGFLFFQDENTITSAEVSFPEFVRLSMIQAANRHMKNVKMGAEYEVMDSWTK